MNQLTVFLSLVLTSLLLIQATTTPATHQELDDEMRGYVKYAVLMLGYDPENFASHVTPTTSWASLNYLHNRYSSYYMITFDREFVERQPTNIKKAIAAHEVGHAYRVCAIIARDYEYGHATYLESENCADVVSAIIYEYEWTLAALNGIKNEMPDAWKINERIKLLEEQLGGIPEREDLDLTYWDE